MTPQILPVDDELRLRPFAGDADVERALPWYQDPATVAALGGAGSPVYDRARVQAMYEALASQGEVYLIERRTSDAWRAVGDVTLAPDTLPIVIAPDARRQGIARRTLLRLVDRARVLEWTELRVREVSADNEASHRLLSGLGFVARADGAPAYVLRLAPLSRR